VEAYGINWPTIRGDINSLIITYDVGPKSLSDVPKAAKAAIKLIVGQYFDRRSNNNSSPFKVKDGPAQYLLQSLKRTFL
jgi:hypothetical protein